jgi:hypothetical protein
MRETHSTGQRGQNLYSKCKKTYRNIYRRADENFKVKLLCARPAQQIHLNSDEAKIRLPCRVSDVYAALTERLIMLAPIVPRMSSRKVEKAPHNGDNLRGERESEKTSRLVSIHPARQLSSPPPSLPPIGGIFQGIYVMYNLNKNE